MVAKALIPADSLGAAKPLSLLLALSSQLPLQIAKPIGVTGPGIKHFPHLLLVFTSFMKTWTSAETYFSLGHFFIANFTSELAGASCEFMALRAAGVAQSKKKKALGKNVPENWVPVLLRHSEKPF